MQIINISIQQGIFVFVDIWKIMCRLFSKVYSFYLCPCFTFGACYLHLAILSCVRDSLLLESSLFDGPEDYWFEHQCVLSYTFYFYDKTLALVVNLFSKGDICCLHLENRVLSKFLPLHDNFSSEYFTLF